MLRERNPWHAPGRRSELCHHALERGRALRAHGRARGDGRAGAIMRNVLAANLQLYPQARLRSFRCTGSDPIILRILFTNQSLRAH